MLGAAESRRLPAGRHDPAARRRGQRRGRERGCWVYISAADLLAAGFDPEQAAPFYRCWVARKGTVLLNLYREA